MYVAPLTAANFREPQRRSLRVAIRVTRLPRLHGIFLNPLKAMRHCLSSLAISRSSTTPRAFHTPLLSRLPVISTRTSALCAQKLQVRSFAGTTRLNIKLPRKEEGNYENSNARPASELNNNITQEEKDDFARKLQEDKGKQIRTPWHREGSDIPPVARQRSAGAMTKGGVLAAVSISQTDVNRQATHDALTNAQDHSSSHNPGHELGPQRHRAACSTCPPTAAHLVP